MFPWELVAQQGQLFARVSVGGAELSLARLKRTLDQRLPRATTNRGTRRVVQGGRGEVSIVNAKTFKTAGQLVDREVVFCRLIEKGAQHRGKEFFHFGCVRKNVR